MDIQKLIRKDLSKNQTKIKISFKKRKSKQNQYFEHKNARKLVRVPKKQIKPKAESQKPVRVPKKQKKVLRLSNMKNQQKNNKTKSREPETCEGTKKNKKTMF